MPDFRCTYRIQLTAGFGFRAAREVVVPYVRDLGASHLYLSPVLQARHGSTHGYDVTDPTRVSDDLGGEAELRALCDAARERDLGGALAAPGWAERCDWWGEVEQRTPLAPD